MTPNHPLRDMIATISAWALARSPIRAVVLTSTRAIPNAPVDVLSDYDVILIVQDIQPFVTDRTWLNDFGDVLVVYWDPIHADPIFGIEKCANVTQYADGLKIDFTLCPLVLFEQIVAAPVRPYTRVRATSRTGGENTLYRFLSRGAARIWAAWHPQVRGKSGHAPSIHG